MAVKYGCVFMSVGILAPGAVSRGAVHLLGVAEVGALGFSP